MGGLKEKPKAVHEIRLGHIKAAVWKNETENGFRHNATFSRIYRDQGQWKSTESFGRDDLLLLAKVADRVHSWIFAQNQEDNGAKGGTPSPNEVSGRQIQFGQ